MRQRPQGSLTQPCVRQMTNRVQQAYDERTLTPISWLILIAHPRRCRLHARPPIIVAIDVVASQPSIDLARGGSKGIFDELIFDEGIDDEHWRGQVATRLSRSLPVWYHPDEFVAFIYLFSLTDPILGARWNFDIKKTKETTTLVLYKLRNCPKGEGT